MTTADLIAAADPEVVEQARDDRAFPIRAVLFLSVLVAAAVVAMVVWWVWGEAQQHGHTTALAIWGSIGLLMAWLVGKDELTYRPRLSRGRPISPVRRWIAYPIMLVLPWLLGWWLVPQEGWWVPLALGPVVVLGVLDLALPMIGLLGPARFELRRAMTRDRDARARLAELELEEIAWTVANRGVPNGAAMLEWIGRVHPELAEAVELTERVPGETRGLTGSDGWLPDSLAPGLRRTLPDGTTLTVQPVEREKTLLLTTPSGEELELAGLDAAVRKRFDWKAHAQTIAAARIAAGPTLLVSARHLSRGLAESRVLVGGGEQSVPLGCAADREVLLGNIALSVDVVGKRRPVGIEVLVPDARAQPGHPPPLTQALGEIADAVRGRVPSVEVAPAVYRGLATMRLVFPGSDREVHVLTLLGARRWLPFDDGDARYDSVLVICDDTGDVFMDELALEASRKELFDAIAERVRGGGLPAAE